MMRHYAIMRRGLHTSSIFFTIPVIGSAFPSWPLLPAPIAACVAFGVCLPAEDDDRREQYGDGPDRCKNTTNALFPTPPRWLRAWGSVRKRKE